MGRALKPDWMYSEEYNWLSDRTRLILHSLKHRSLDTLAAYKEEAEFVGGPGGVERVSPSRVSNRSKKHEKRSNLMRRVPLCRFIDPEVS